MPRNILNKKRVRAFLSRGQTLVEYALILAFISVVAITSLLMMGGQVSSVYTTVSLQLSSASVGGTQARAH